MLYKTLLNIFCSLVLLVVGALLGDGYKSSLYLYWLMSIALLTVIVQLLIVRISNLETENVDLNNKISILTVGKKINGNIGDIQCVCFPKTASLLIEKDREVTLEVYVSSLIPLDIVPDIKLITNIEWEVSVNHQLKRATPFAGNYEYMLKAPSLTNVGNKFFKYSFQTKIRERGDNQFFIEINNGNEKAVLHNVLKVI